MTRKLRDSQPTDQEYEDAKVSMIREFIASGMDAELADGVAGFNSELSKLINKYNYIGASVILQSLSGVVGVIIETSVQK